MHSCLDGRRVLVVCDDTAVWSIVSTALCEAGASVNRRASLDAAWALLGNDAVDGFDAIVLDLDTARDSVVESGLELALAWQETQPKPPCWVALSGRDTKPSRAAAERACAVAMLTKSDGLGEDLVATLSRTPSSESMTAGGMTDSSARGHAVFDEMEIELIEHIARGLTNKEIADKRDCTEAKVKHTLTKLRRRANVSNRAELVAVLRDNGRP